MCASEINVSGSSVDLFLSYNHLDRESVAAVRQQVEVRGIRTFFDRQYLAAGLPWPQAIEAHLRSARAVAVFIGRHGLGIWQKREMYFALDRQVEAERENRSFPVIPVLLEGADLGAGFLFLNTWVDLRDLADAASIDTLILAVDGTAPADRVEAPYVVCPYRGLRAFREEDAGFFHGRQPYIEGLLRVALSQPVVAVVGPSGSGKSSVVMAGVIPRLRQQRPPCATWDAIVFTPGGHPWRMLADALAPLLRATEAGELARDLENEGGALESAIKRALRESGGTDRLLVVVDQLEELFDLAPAQVRAPFLRVLLEVTKSAPVTLAFTLRADYYGRALETSREFVDALNAAQLSLGPMTPGELREVIEKPAHQVRLQFEPGLADAILGEVVRQRGNLPLLEYALTQLWEARDRDRLTHAAYKQMGEVSRTVAVRAELVYGSLDARHETAARRLFLRLVRVSSADAEGADTRRRVGRSEAGEDGWEVAQRFAAPENRLLVISLRPGSDEQSVEVAHEAIIRHWDRMRDWVDEDRTFLLWRQRLEIYLAPWEASGGADRGTLLRGAPLAEAQRWFREKREDLSERERDFIQQGVSSAARTRTVVRAIAAAAVIALVGYAAALFYEWTDFYQVRAMLGHADFRTSPGRFATLVFLGRTEEARRTALAERVVNDQVAALGSIAEALTQAGSAEEAGWALAEAERIARSIDHRQARAHLLSLVAGATARVGRPDEALRVWQQIEEPRDTTALRFVADALARANRFEEARKLEPHLDPWSRAVVSVAVAKALARAGRAGEARQALAPITKAEDRSRALCAVALALVKAGRAREAEGILEEAEQAALQIDDRDAKNSVLKLVAEATTAADQFADARRAADQITKPDDRALALLTLWVALDTAGRTEEASQVQKEIRFSDHPRFKISLAAFWLRAGRPEFARSLLDDAKLFVRALDSDRDRSEAMASMAKVYARLRRYRDARLAASDCLPRERGSAYVTILTEYAKERNPTVRSNLESGEDED